ncbi:MAG: segregation and condensation protein A [Bacilli bacterium]
MEYVVKIDEFEGPLDLLLHLIKSSEIDIYEISIFDITRQYISYIKTMKKMNLEIASEYLEMAADLIKIKSAMLLPKPVLEKSDDFEDDPRDILIKRLIEYKKYKIASDKFVVFKTDREKTYTKIYNDEFEVLTPIVIDKNVDVFNLLKALNKMKRRKESLKPLTTVIEENDISVEDRMESLYNYLKMFNNTVVFTDIFTTYEKSYVITTFLAVLELVKENKIKIFDIKDDDFSVSILI